MKRLFFAIPIFYSKGGFWTRDSGLVVLVLRKMGYEAWLVALNNPEVPIDDEPVLRISLSEMQSPVWWKSQKPDAVLLTGWGDPRHDCIRRAALASTPRVVERLDTDGIRMAHLFPRLFFSVTWASFWDRHPAPVRWLAIPVASFRLSVRYLFPFWNTNPMVETMQLLPQVIVESPVAAERIRQVAEIFSVDNFRISIIPHPVNDAILQYEGLAKENQIISVGRWDAAQKDYPFLRKVLREFLKHHPDWTACVVGREVPAKDKLRSMATEEWEKRVIYHETLDHEQLKVEYGRSKIYLMVSRYESFCIAAAEALCCGCSVVGSRDVSTSPYFAETESGIVAETRTQGAFSETLDRELEAWTQGRRNPGAIAVEWKARAGADAVARATLQFMTETPER